MQLVAVCEEPVVRKMPLPLGVESGRKNAE